MVFKVLVSGDDVYCCKYCTGFWSKLFGLRFKNGFGNWDGYLFSVCEDTFMDSFFVNFGFNIHWLSEEYEVIKTERVSGGEWRVFSPVSGQCFVLETPIGSCFAIGTGFDVF